MCIGGDGVGGDGGVKGLIRSGEGWWRRRKDV